MLSDIEIFATGVRTAASKGHTVIVDGFPFDLTAAICVELDSEELLRLIAVVKPRLLYVDENRFDCDVAIDECLANLSIEATDDIDVSPLSGPKRYGKANNGKLCRIYVGFVADGVLHACFEDADWHVEFKDEIEELSDRLRSVLAENRKNSNMISALEMKRKAKILANDPAFNFQRASREKRMYLAQELFPECDYRDITLMVDEATNIDYLSKARSSDS